jgi:hypothetical protein
MAQGWVILIWGHAITLAASAAWTHKAAVGLALHHRACSIDLLVCAYNRLYYLIRLCLVNLFCSMVSRRMLLVCVAHRLVGWTPLFHGIPLEFYACVVCLDRPS